MRRTEPATTTATAARLVAVGGLALALGLAAAAPAGAALERRGSVTAALRLVTVGSFERPLYVTAPPGDRKRIFVVEKGGTVRIVRGGAILPTPFLDVRSHILANPGQGGLLSIAFAPDYKRSGLVYAAHTEHDQSLVIREFHAAPGADVVDAGAGRLVLTVPHPASKGHYGGQLQFGPDGDLYLSTGDSSFPDPDVDGNGQNLSILLAKLLRIDPHATPTAPYGIPPGQPIAPGARPEIYAYGLRNPWRFSFDSTTGALIVADVGDMQREEVDFAPGGALGADFGWSCYEGSLVFAPHQDWPVCQALAASGTAVPPDFEYGHDVGCSITGGYVVRDPQLPALAGRYLYGDYCTGALSSVVLHAGGSADDAPLGLTVPELTSFGRDGRNRLYATSDAGTVYRLKAGR